MAGLKQQQSSKITLKGSAEMIVEFLDYGINSILYQRGVYPAETFKHVQNYGLNLLLTTDEKLKEYLGSVLNEMKNWIEKNQVKKLSLVVSDIDTKEVFERWDFSVENEESNKENSVENNAEKPKKSIKDIQKEIRDVIKQITAMIACLPLLDTQCTFDLLVHMASDCNVPEEWSERGPCYIPNSEEVRLRSFSTMYHKVDTVVSYKTTF